MQIMITNGGPHPADKWAEVTTKTILDLIKIDDDSTSSEAFAARQAKRDLQPKLFSIFMEGCNCAQQEERVALNTDTKRCNKPMRPHDHINEIMPKFTAVMAQTPFAAHFSKKEVDHAIRFIIGQHLANVMHVERCWHKDRLEAAKGA